MASADKPILSTSSLSLTLGETRILNGVDLAIAQNQKVGVIGPNGSGKTTLFNCLSGFHYPSGGQIFFKDRDITKLSPPKRSKLGLGRLFQNFGIFKEMTVLENIVVALESKLPPSFFPWSEQEKKNRARAMDYLAEVNLESKAKDKAGSLSGGQLRLLEISRLLAFGADFYLLDEPTAGVSPKMKGEIEKALRKLQDLNATVLIIEHDINFIQRLCDRVVVLDVGKVVLDGTPDSVRQDPRLQEVYFGNETAEWKS
ncbi:MAG: ATP-binding cassette domain-containing protein [Bdellovibrionales bacterium]|nr:ATP-binding cassette domain-containing protein [Bdellovibrionales bacterium]